MSKFEFSTLVVVLFTLLHISSCQLYDETRLPESQGRDVVDATIQILRQSLIFPGDQGFLRRLAVVESAFGNLSTTYRPGYDGGIWQVDEHAFDLTKDASSLDHFYDLIKRELGIDWSTVVWRDLRKPIFSAIAARLFLLQVNLPIPGTIAAQALFWVQHYRPTGDSQIFEDEVHYDEKGQSCTGMVDICMVMDGSGSIGLTDFQKAIESAKRLSESFTLDPVTGARISFLVYSSSYIDHFDFTNTMDGTAMSDYISKVPYPGGGTATGEGILRGLHYFDTAPPRAIEGIPQVMMTFTDGESNTGTSVTDAAEAIRNAGILSIAVGIGTAFIGNPVAEAELLTIAHGIEVNVLKVDDYDAFVELVNELNGDVCKVPQTPPIGTNSSGVVEFNEKRYYEIGQPLDGITVKVKANNRFTGWYAYSYPNPSSAIYDGILNGDATFIPYPTSSQTSIRTDPRVYVTIQGDSAPGEATDYTLLVEEGDTTPEQSTEPPSSPDPYSTTPEPEPVTTTIEPTSTSTVTIPSPTTTTPPPPTETTTTPTTTTTPWNPVVTFPSNSSPKIRTTGSLVAFVATYFLLTL